MPDLCQTTLRDDRFELSFVPEYGCHWTRLRLAVRGDWLDFLVPIDAPQSLVLKQSGNFGSFALAPWSNRIAAGVFTFAGTRCELRQNGKDGTAMHGDVRSRPWRVTALDEHRFEATLDSREHAGFNFPFHIVYRQEFRLEAGMLRVQLAMENVDVRPAPVGMGFHPYFHRRLSPRDADVDIALPADLVYPAEGCIPTGPPVAVDLRTDLRVLRPLGNPDLDHCYTGLTDPTIYLRYPGTGATVRMRLDPVFGHVVLFAPRNADGSPRHFVAVEPVTIANDGFNLASRGYTRAGVKVLSPGERWGGGWTLSVDPPGADPLSAGASRR